MNIILIFICLLFITIVIKLKYTFNPVGVLSFIWVLLIIFTIICQSFIELKYYGLFYLISLIFLSSCGYYIANKFLNEKINNFNIRQINHHIFSYILIIITLLGFINPIQQIFAHGFTFENFSSLDSFTQMTNQFSVDRYSNSQIGYSKLTQLLLIFTYSAPILGGFIWLIANSKLEKLFSILSILPCIIIMVTQSTKMQLFSAFIFWFSGLLTCKFTYNIKFIISVKKIVFSIFSIIIFFSLLFVSLLTRWNNKIDENKINDTKRNFICYAFGSVPCFDYWFSDESNKYYEYSVDCLLDSKCSLNPIITKYENGITMSFDKYLTTDYFDILNDTDNDFVLIPNQKYTLQFVITSNSKPLKVDYCLHKDYKKSNIIEIQNVIEIPNNSWQTSWLYWQTFSFADSLKNIKLPNIRMSIDKSKYIKITNFRIDTGNIALPWVKGDGNICFIPKFLSAKLCFGEKTLYGISNLFGLAKREIGVYRIHTYFNSHDNNYHSNVYTAFRLLIEDFGRIGACIFMFLLGFISSKAINFIQRRKYLALSQTILISIYCYVMWSFVTSFWAYTSHLGAFGLTFIVLYIVQKPLKNKKNEDIKS